MEGMTIMVTTSAVHYVQVKGARSVEEACALACEEVERLAPELSRHGRKTEALPDDECDAVVHAEGDESPDVYEAMRIIATDQGSSGDDPQTLVEIAEAAPWGGVPFVRRVISDCYGVSEHEWCDELRDAFLADAYALRGEA